MEHMAAPYCRAMALRKGSSRGCVLIWCQALRTIPASCKPQTNLAQTRNTCIPIALGSGVQRVYGEGGARIPLPMWKLAVTNFAQEWISLRRSFRYNEYSRIARRNPPQGPFGTVRSRQGLVVAVASQLLSSACPSVRPPVCRARARSGPVHGGRHGGARVQRH